MRVQFYNEHTYEDNLEDLRKEGCVMDWDDDELTIDMDPDYETEIWGAYRVVG